MELFTILTALTITVGVVYYLLQYKPKVGDIVIVTHRHRDRYYRTKYHYTGIITSVKGSVIVVDAMLYGTTNGRNTPLDTRITDNRFDLSDKNVSVKLLVKSK